MSLLLYFVYNKFQKAFEMKFYHHLFLVVLLCFMPLFSYGQVCSSVLEKFDSIVCAGKQVFGYDSSGMYLDTFSIGPSCDSIRRLNLVVLDSSQNTWPSKKWSHILASNASSSYLIKQITDRFDNLYTIGVFKGGADFDPSDSSSFIMNAPSFKESLFITKRDRNGNFVWGKQISNPFYEGISASDIFIGKDESVYFTGRVDDGSDFDPGPGSYTYPNTTLPHFYVCKFTIDGELAWVKFLSGYIIPNALGVDDSGKVYITGKFDYTMDFDPGPDTVWAVSPNPNSSSGYVLKLSALGDFVWVKTLVSGSSTARDLELDSLGQPIVVGTYTSPIDFDPGPDSLIIAPNDGDAYMWKLDTAGALVWAKTFYGDNFPNYPKIDIDPFQNIIVMGEYNGRTDFLSGPGSVALVSPSRDLFIAKFDFYGDLLWVKELDNQDPTFGSIIGVIDVETDRLGNIYGIGYYRGSLDFDPGPGQQIYTSTPSSTNFFYIVKLDKDGNFNWTESFRTKNNEYVYLKSVTINSSLDVTLGTTFTDRVMLPINYDTIIHYQPVHISSSISGSMAVFTLKQYAEELIDTIVCPGETVFGYNSQGSYQDILSNNSCLNTQRTVNIQFYADTVRIDTSICYGRSLQGYSNTGVYIDQLNYPAGCAYTQVLDLLVVDTSLNIEYHTICAGDTFENYHVTGTYVEYYTNQAGCDSTRVIELSVQDTSITTLVDTICEGDTINGYSSAGTYTDVFTGSTGCDSTVVLQLSVLDTALNMLFFTICEADTLSTYGYTDQGVYTNIYNAANGCDSTVVINVIVLDTTIYSFSRSICQGDTFESYTRTGTYVDTFLGANSCDSIRILDLTVLDTTIAFIDSTVCNGERVSGYASTGIYTDHFLGANGCDSTRVLNLTVLDTSLTQLFDTICEGDTTLGFFTTGIHTLSFSNAVGCDSTVMLDLYVKSTVLETLTQTICLNDTVFGYTQTGVYTDTYVGSNGCDSIRILDLTVLSPSVTTLNFQICEGDSVNGYTTSGTFTDTFTSAYGCDSIRTLNLQVDTVSRTDTSVALIVGDSILINGTYVFTNGSYYDTLISQNGCDSIVELQADFVTGIDLSSSGSVEIYPNPFTSLCTIQLGKLTPLVSSISIYSVLGEVVFSTNEIKSSMTIDLARLQVGVYVVVVSGIDINSSKKVVKFE